MPRPPNGGYVQVSLLRLLERRAKKMSTADLAAKVFRTRPCTASQRAVTFRALSTMAAHGLVQKAVTPGGPTFWTAAAKT